MVGLMAAPGVGPFRRLIFYVFRFNENGFVVVEADGYTVGDDHNDVYLLSPLDLCGCLLV